MQQYINVMNKLPGYPHPCTSVQRSFIVVQNLLKTHYWVSLLLRMTQMSKDCCLFQWNRPFCSHILSGNLQRSPSERTDIIKNSFMSCLLLPAAEAPASAPWRPVQRSHFPPAAETLIVINGGIHQDMETRRKRFILAITRTESNFGFKSSREMRLKKTHDARRAAGRQSAWEKHGVTSPETLLARCIFICNATFIANREKYDCAQCPDGRTQSG